jgi:predicted nucleotidyltransferase
VATARSVELRALAQRVVDALPAAAEDVVLTGSTSRGVADELSDVELLVVPEELPSLEECVRIGEAAGLRDLNTWTPPAAAVYWSGGFADREFVELIWWPRVYVEERVRAIVTAEIVDAQRLRTAEALVHGVALRGAALGGWRAKLETYPELLAERIVDDAAAAWHEVPRSELTLLRPGARLVLAQRLVEDAENLLRIVFALNRTWQQGWKHLEAVLAPLPRQPERLTERLDTALADFDLRAMRELVQETLALAPDSPAVVRARREVSELLERLG